MTMGQRIRQAREEAGLSQRELAGEEITRNMLSALEHDGANPSLHTLRYLSKRLGKSVSYFVEEEQGAGQSLRDYGTMPPGDCLEGLKDAQHTPQNDLLRSVCLLDLAEEAVQQGRIPYAKTLLERAQEWMEGRNSIWRRRNCPNNAAANWRSATGSWGISGGPTTMRWADPKMCRRRHEKPPDFERF